MKEKIGKKGWKRKLKMGQDHLNGSGLQSNLFGKRNYRLSDWQGF